MKLQFAAVSGNYSNSNLLETVLSSELIDTCDGNEHVTQCSSVSYWC